MRRGGGINPCLYGSSHPTCAARWNGLGREMQSQREREGTPARVRRSLRPNGRQALHVQQKKCGLRLKTKLAAEPTGFVSDKSPAAWGRCKYAEVEQNRFNLQHP